MSKKTDKFDMDFGTDDFDFDDAGAGFEGSPEPKGRAPVRKLMGGLKSGIGKQLADEDQQRTFIDKALPDGYATTYDAVKSGTKAVAGMYREATKEFDSVNQAAKDAARKILPRIKQHLPHKIHAKLSNYAGAGRSHHQRDYQEDELQQNLMDMFGPEGGGGNAADSRKAAMTPIKDSKGILDLASDMVASKQRLDLNQGINRLVRFAQKRDDYDTTVGAKLARKQIELSYRQLFAQNKMVDYLKQTMELHEASYKDLIQNTSLPDMLKSHKSEELHAVMKKNFYGKIAAPISTTINGVVGNIAGKVKTKIKSSFSEVANNIAFGSDMLEMMMEMQALEAELESLNGNPMAPEKTAKMQFLEMALENGGAMAGGHMTKKASMFLAKAIKKRYGDNDKVKRVGLAGKNISNNAAGYFQHFLKNSMYGGGLLAGVSNWAGLGDMSGGKQSNLLQRSRDDLTKQSFFTNKTDLSITKIMPGLLAKIHQELRIIRTGDASHEAISFSFENDKFEEAHVRRKRAYDRLFDGDAVKNTQENSDKVLSSIDPEGKLSPDAQKQLKEYIHEVAHDDSSMMDLRKLVAWDSPIKGKAKDEITEFLQQKYGITDMDEQHTYNNASGSKIKDKFNQWTDGATFNKVRADANASMAYQQMQDKMTGAMKDMRSGLPQDFNKALDMTMEDDIDVLRQMGLAKKGSTYGDWEYDRTEMERLLKGGERRTKFGGGGRRGNRDDGAVLGGVPDPDDGGGGGSGGLPPSPGPAPSNPFRYHSFRPNVGQPASANTDQQKIVDKLDEVKKSIEAKAAAANPNAAPAFEFKDAWEEFKAMQTVRDETTKTNWERHHATAESALQMILTQGAAGGGVDMSHLQSSVSGGIIKKNPWIKKNWMAVKTLGASTWSGMSGALKFSGGLTKGILGGGFGLGKSIIGGGLGIAGSALGFLAGKTEKMKKSGGGGMFQGKLGDKPIDLYVKGEETPRLLAAKMIAGEYREYGAANAGGVKSGYRISKPSDIKTGNVTDLDGNQILTPEEFKKGLYAKVQGSVGVKLLAGGAKMIGKGIALAGSILGAPFKVTAMAGRALKWLFGKTVKIAARMMDIYVSGESKPRLLATLLNNGGYVCDGKPIMKLRDIIGEVKTVDGEVVLTHSDIQKGLVWYNGKPVELDKSKLMSFAKKALMLPLKLAGGALKLGFKLLKLPFKALKLGFKGLGMLGRGMAAGLGKLTGETRKMAAQEMQVQLLEAILQQLQGQGSQKKDFQDPDGDGVRNGSALDRWKAAMAARLSGKKTDGATPPPPPGVKGGGGMGMMLFTAVTGAIAEVKHLKTEAVGWLKKIAMARTMQAAAGGLGDMGNESTTGRRGRRGRRGGRMGPPRPPGRMARFGGLASKFGTPGKLIGGAALMYGANRMMDGGEDDEEGGGEGGGGPVNADGTPAAKPGLWDKYGKPAASFAASTAAWHYGMKGAGKLFSQGGRAELMQGARGIGSRLGMMKNGIRAIGQRVAPTLGRMGARQIAMGIGRQALMQGARTALLYGATALGAVVASPVLIGAAVVLAVGALAYGIYKWKHRKVDIIQNFRMNQYGYEEGDDNHCTQILTLEKMLIAKVKMTGGKAVIGNGVSTKNLMDIFKVKDGDKAAMLKLTTWFQYRFKPIFLGHITTYFKLTKGTSIFDADTKLNRDQRKQMLSDVNISGSGSSSPYSYMSSPFNGEDQVKLDYNAISSKFSEYMTLVDKLDDPTSKSRSKLQKYLTDPMKKFYASSKAFAKKEWADAKKAASSVWASTKSFSKDVWGGMKSGVNAGLNAVAGWVPEGVKNVGRSIAEGAKTALANAQSGAGTMIEGAASVGRSVAGGVQDVGHGIATAYRKLTGSVKDRQMQVFQSFINAGFSKNQAVALTAEVGRENDYGGAMFGTHTDYASGPNAITNLGYISWNGSRKAKLQAAAKAAGLLNPDGSMKQGQASLDLQAKFVMEEMKGPYARAMKGFIDKADVDPEAAAAQLGRKYVGWAYGQDTLRNGKHFDWHSADNKRRNYLKNIMDVVGKVKIDTKAVSTAPLVAPKGAGTVPVKTPTPTAAAAAAPVPAGVSPKASPLPSAGMPGMQTPSSTTVGGGGASPAASAPATATGVPPVDPALVALGKKATKVASDATVTGMNAQFMNLFYAMVGEYWKATGRSVQVNSGFRDSAKQKVMYEAYLCRGKTKPLVAAPGRSKHEKGLAIDINSAEANEMDSMGLMRKYKFHRPLLKHPSCPEPWHVENLCFGAGAAADNTTKAIITDGKKPVTQGDLNKTKQDPGLQKPGSGSVPVAAPKAIAPIGNGSEAAAASPTVQPTQTQQIASSRMPSMGGGGDQVAAIAQRERQAKTDADMDGLRTTSADQQVKEQKLTNMKLDTIIQLITAASQGQMAAAKTAQEAAQKSGQEGSPQNSQMKGQTARSMKDMFANPPVNFGL